MFPVPVGNCWRNCDRKCEMAGKQGGGSPAAQLGSLVESCPQSLVCSSEP